MRAILTWHSLDRSGSPISVAPEEFHRQLVWLAGSGVRITTVDRLLTLEETVHAAALTFDDGYANFAGVAAPALAEFGLSATIFVVTGHVGRDNRWGGREQPGIPSLPLLGWDELARLRETGITLAAHTNTHPRLGSLDPERLAGEIAGAADLMESRLGDRPAGFAYPYGELTRPALRLVEQTYRWACTTEFRSMERQGSPHRLPRIDAWYLKEASRRAGWGSRRFRNWVWLRRQGRRAGSWLRRASGR